MAAPTKRFFDDHTPTLQELEQVIQNRIVVEFELCQRNGYNFEFAGDMNAGKRSQYEAMWAKATGMKKGETDLRVYFPGGRIVLLEIKLNAAVSKDQKIRHARLKDLGFDVRVWRIKDPEEARKEARRFIENEFSDTKT